MSSQASAAKVAAACFGFLLLGSLHTTRAQANDAPANPPSQKSAESASPSKSTEAVSAAPTPRAHKVITNDDIEAAHVRPRPGEPTGPVTGTGQCDEDCAQQVRDWMGYQSWQDGEWHLQIEAARIKLAADSDWQGAYADACTEPKTTAIFNINSKRPCCRAATISTPVLIAPSVSNTRRTWGKSCAKEWTAPACRCPG